MPLSEPPVQQQLNTFPLQQTWVQWFGSIRRLLTYIRNDGSIEPVNLSNSDAQNNSVYYSSDSSDYVYKDSSGAVNSLTGGSGSSNTGSDGVIDGGRRTTGQGTFIGGRRV